MTPASSTTLLYSSLASSSPTKTVEPCGLRASPMISRYRAFTYLPPRLLRSIEGSKLRHQLQPVPKPRPHRSVLPLLWRLFLLWPLVHPPETWAPSTSAAGFLTTPCIYQQLSATARWPRYMHMTYVRLHPSNIIHIYIYLTILQSMFQLHQFGTINIILKYPMPCLFPFRCYYLLEEKNIFQVN